MDIQTVEHFNDCYKVTLAGGEICIVPQDSLNADYLRVQAWVAAGGIIS